MKLEQIDRCVDYYNKLDSTITALRKLGVEITGHFSNTIWLLFEDYVHQFDVAAFISWYIYDNECGKNELTASVGRGKSIKVRNTKDLLKLINAYERIENLQPSIMLSQKN